MNDAEIRRIARAAQQASVESVDVDGDLRAVRRRIANGDDGSRVTDITAAESKPRVLRLALVGGLAAAALIAAVVAVNLNDDPTILTNTPEPVATTGVPTTVPTPSSTVAPTTDVPATTAPATTIAVDAANPPTLIEPVPLVSLPLEPNPGGNSISVAIGEREIAVRQPATSDVTLIDYRAEQPAGPPVRTVALAEPLSSMVFGPGDVLYGFGEAAPPVGGSAMPEALRYVAVALSGARQGEVVAENRLDVNTYLELPWGAFGHGPDGVIDRLRTVNEVVAGYVDVNGDPAEWTEPAPALLAPIGDLTANPLTIDTLDGATSWTLAITRAPDNASDFVGPPPPAPTTGGRYVYFDRIGANLTGGDFGPSAMPVIAILEPGGSGTWVRLPDEWSVVASDVWGTVLMRTTDTAIELALLDDALAP